MIPRIIRIGAGITIILGTPQGPAGPPGPQGPAGNNGTNGTNGSDGRVSLPVTMTGNDHLRPAMMGQLVNLDGYTLSVSLTGDDTPVNGFVIAQGPGTISGGQGDLDVPELMQALISYSNGGSTSYQLVGASKTILTDGLGPPSTPQTVSITGSLTVDGNTIVTPGTLYLVSSNDSQRQYTSTGEFPVAYGFFLVTSDGIGATLYYYQSGVQVASWTGETASVDPSQDEFTGVSPATGTAVVTNGDVRAASFIGQTCRAGLGSPYQWYRAAEINPTIWEEF